MKFFELQMKSSLAKIYINAVLAGIFIGMAGTVYLAVPNSLAGAFLFGFGLLTILCYELKLYTGAIGYFVVQKQETFRYFIALIFIWLGNLTGCYLVGRLIRNSRSALLVTERAEAICAMKLADSPSSLLILSFFCGILMYLAVESFRRKSTLDAVIRVPMVFLCVAIFILSGFEHCIANMFYFSVAAVWSWHTLLAVLIMTLGNSLGGMLLPAAEQIRHEKK